MESAYFIVASCLGTSGAILWKQREFDLAFFQWIERLRTRLTENERKEKLSLLEVDWLQQILLSVRTGQSLESALEQYCRSLGAGKIERHKSWALLHGSPENDSVSQLLFESLHGGTACGPTLQFLRASKMAEIKGRRKLRALTLGARMQAVVLACIPWLLLASFFLVDDEIAVQLWHSKVCWIIWLIALVLCVVGFRWMKHILAKNIRAPNKRLQEQEEELPSFLLDLVAQVSSGRDIAESASLAAQKLPEKSSLKIACSTFSQTNMMDEGPWSTIRSLLRKAHEQGAPLREEIFLLLQELQSQKEARWEELAQKLPLLLLAPLFSCFFLAALLMSFSLLVPFLENF